MGGGWNANHGQLHAVQMRGFDRRISDRGGAQEKFTLLSAWDVVKSRLQVSNIERCTAPSDFVCRAYHQIPHDISYPRFPFARNSVLDEFVPLAAHISDQSCCSVPWGPRLPRFRVLLKSSFGLSCWRSSSRRRRLCHGCVGLSTSCGNVYRDGRRGASGAIQSTGHAARRGTRSVGAGLFSRARVAKIIAAVRRTCRVVPRFISPGLEATHDRPLRSQPRRPSPI